MKRGHVALAAVTLASLLAALLFVRNRDVQRRIVPPPPRAELRPVQDPRVQDERLRERARKEREASTEAGRPEPRPRRALAEKESVSNPESPTVERRLTDAVVQVNAGLREKNGQYRYRSSRYGATFSEAGLNFQLPGTVDDLEHPNLTYGLGTLRSADGTVAARTAQPVSTDGFVSYDRGAYEERFVPRSDGVEHIVVLNARPGSGDLSCTVPVNTSLRPARAGDRIVYRHNERDLISISHAIAVDASGRRLPLELEVADGGISYSVPARWLDEATYPVLLDPLVGGITTVDGSVSITEPLWIRGVDVAYNSTNNEWLVVWSELWSGNFDYDVWGQRYNISATFTLTAVGAAFFVTGSLQGDREPAVSYAPNVNRYLVAYTYDPSDNGDTADRDIRGAILDNLGNVVVGPFAIDPAANRDEWADVAYDGSQWYVVRTHWTGGTDPDLYGSFVTTGGVGGGIADPDTEADNAAGPSVAFGSGVYCIVWEKGGGSAEGNSPVTNRLDLDSIDIYGRTMSTAGAFNTGITLLNNTTQNHGFPDVSAGTNSFLVVWNRAFTTTDRDIHGVIFSNTLTPLTGTIFIENDVIDQLRPRAAFSSTNGEWLTVFSDNITGSRDIYCNRVSSSGSVLDGSGIQVSTSGDVESWPAVAWHSNRNDMLMAWLDLTGTYTVLARRFTMDYISPPVPTLLSPGNGSYTNDTTPTFDWTDSADTGGSLLQNYDLQVDNSGATFPSPEIDTSFASSNFTPGAGLPADGTYWWRVRARDWAGNLSGWSAVLTFTLDTVPPSGVTLLSPANGSSTNDTTPTFDWTDATDANPLGLYDIQVDDSGGGFPSPEINTTSGPSTFTPGTPLVGNPPTTYSWRVRARDAAGNAGPWSATFTFTVNTVPPDVPTGVVQSDNSLSAGQPAGYIDDDGTVFFRDTISDPAAENVQLQVQIAPVGDDTFTGGSVVTLTSPLVASGSTAEVSAALADGPYHWRARTIDVLGNASAWHSFGGNPEASADFSVQINAPPGAPGTLQQVKFTGGATIAIGAATNETTVTLRATADDPDGNQYQLEVEVRPVGTAFTGTPTHTGALFPDNTEASVNATGLSDQVSYHWQVRARDSAGATSAWVTFGGNAENPPTNPAATDFVVDLTPQAPNTPANLVQLKNDEVTVIAVGQTTNELLVKLRGQVSDPDPGSVELRLQVEVKPVGTAFTNTPSAQSAPGASGAILTATVSGLANNTDYHWQARTIDAEGNVSGWVSYPTPPSAPNAETTADFHTSTTNTNPGVPTAVSQENSGGAIGVGASTNETTVLFKATVSDPDAGQLVRLEIELRETSQSFTGTPTHTSGFVSSGTQATISVPGLATNTNWHWRYRAADNAPGGASAWTSFGGNADGATDFHVNAGPTTSVSAGGEGQFRSDNTAIAVGGNTAEPSVVCRATVTDPEGSTVRLQVEVKPIGTAFDGTGIVQSGLVASGSLISVTVPGLAPASYHWRARGEDSSGLAGPWSVFGGNSEGPPADVDFTVTVNSAPLTPTGLGQFKSDGSTVISTGATTNETTVVFKATVNDPDGGQLLRLQLELRPVGTAFTSPTPLVPDGVVFFESAPVTGGTVATITVSGIAANDYHWQVRVVDDQAPAGTSGWASYGGNAETDVDFRVNTAPPDPTLLDQLRTDGVTSIAPNGSTNEISVLLRATLGADADPGQTVQLQVQVCPNADAFGGGSTITGSSGFVASGVVTVTISNLVSVTAYKWRARAVDSVGGVSNWIGFPPGDPDFTVDTSGATNAPAAAGAAQRDEAGDPDAANGFVDQDNQMVFRATLSDADVPAQTIKLQIELRPTSDPLTGTMTHESAFLAPGVAQITVSGLAVGPYHWQYRAVDSGGNASAWTAFNATVPNFRINGQPAAPMDHNQYKTDLVTVIPVGNTTNEGTVVIQATVTDSDATPDDVKLQVELRAVGTPFTSPAAPAIDGVVFFESPFVASGSIVQVTMGGLVNNTNYRWQARIVDAVGGASAWTTFGGNADPGDTDFKVFLNQPPSLSGAGQFKSDGATAIPTGGSTNENTLLLKATVNDPDPGQTIRLQIEIRPVTAAFTNMQAPGDAIGDGVFFEGPAVSSGTVASVTVSGLANDNYHWQVRAVDSLGTFSAWQSFGGNTENPPTNPAATDVAIAVAGGNAAPLLPSLMDQYKADGISPIPLGATIGENVVVFKADVYDPESGNVKLQVELKAVGVAFNGTGLSESAFVASGSTASVMVINIAGGSYHWRARAMDAQGAASGWVAFGGNSDVVPAATDFAVDTSGNNPPSLPSGPGQYQLDGTTPIAIGATTNQSGVVFKAVVGDPDAGQSIKLQVEIQPLGFGFSGIPTGESGYHAAGELATVTVLGMSSGSYHWRIRSVDSAGTGSAWVSFGGNSESSADFVVALGANTAPSDPTGLGQFKSDGTTAIALGTATNETTVVFRATVADPDGGNVRLRIEVKAVGVAFTGTSDLFESAFVSSGSVATVTISGLGSGISYHWRARSVDPSDTPSAWVSFGGNTENPPTNPAASDFDVNTGLNVPPTDPASLTQSRTDGAAIPMGGSTNETSVVFTATVSDPNAGGILQLQVECVDTAIFPAGTITASSGWVTNGSVATVVQSGLVNGISYRWRARVVDVNGAVSGWVLFGGNPDFTKTPNTPPSVPANIDQIYSTGFPIPIGGKTGEGFVRLVATLTDADGDVVRLQIEVRPVGVTFTNGVLATSPGVSSGSNVQYDYSNLLNGTAYHWQVRAIDSSGAVSAWVAFGGNAESETDFETDQSFVMNAGGSKNLQSVGGGGGGCSLGAASTEIARPGWLLALLTFALLLVLAKRRD